MKHTFKKTAAFVLSAALVAGAVPANVNSGRLLGGADIVAHALENSFDTSTGTLTLSGDIVNLNGYEGIVLPDGVEPEDVIHVVTTDGAVLPESCGFLFSACTNMVSADLSNADASSTITMADMFECCEKLESVNLSGLDTSNVTSIMCMFGICPALTTVEWDGFCTDNVTDVSGLFMECTSLEQINLYPLNTANVGADMDNDGYSDGNMQYMFNNCSSLKTVDVSNFDISNMTADGFGGMFGGCSSLTAIYASEDWDAVATDSDNMFYDCTSLPGYDESKTDGSSAKIGNGGYFTAQVELDGTEYKQTAESNGKYYTRFVFVVPKIQFAGKSAAKFTVTDNRNGNTYDFTSHKYYAGMLSNGNKYIPDGDDEVLFVITVSSGSDISADLTCALNFE